MQVVTSELVEGAENCGGADRYSSGVLSFEFLAFILMCNAVAIAPRLVDGVNVTTDDQHMWLAPLTPGTQHTLTLTLDTPTALSALRVWNYNKSAEDTYRGVSCQLML